MGGARIAQNHVPKMAASGGKWQEDSRGVLRGSCTMCECPCYGMGPGGSIKCSCGHPPGKHMKKGGSGEF